MSVTAAPVLNVAGLAVPAAGSGTLVAIGELRLTWGRSSILDRPTPATASITVLDTSAGATFARRTDLIGQPVLLAYKSGSTTRVNFRGRVTDVSAVPRQAGGYVVALAASSTEVEWANYTAPAGTSWPAETIGARMGRVRALMPGHLTGGWGQAFWDSFGVAAGIPATLAEGMACAPADVGGRSCLDLIGELSASMHPVPLIYDPVDDGLGPALRRRFAPSGAAHVTASAGLVLDPDRGIGGRYVLRALQAVDGVDGHQLDGGLTRYSGSLDQPIDSRITRVELSYLDSAAAYGQRTVTVLTAAGALESTIGRRVLSVSTIHATASNATALATLYADIVDREGSAPRLGTLTYRTAREPLHSLDHARLMLGGVERPAALFVSDAWPTRLGQRPLVGVIGGVIRYRAGEWECDLTTAAAVVDPAPYSWAPLTVAAAASSRSVRLRDVDRSVTFADLAFIDRGAGYTSANAIPYKGNPTQ